MRRRGLLAVGAVLVVATGWILWGELSGTSGQEFALASHELSIESLMVAAVLTAASYAVLTGYELLAFANAGVPLARWRVVATSFVGYAISNTVGGSILSGAAVRYRFYSRWGIPTRQIAEVVAFGAGTFWLGLLVIGGWGLWRSGLPLFQGGDAAGWTNALGAGMLVTAPLYLLASVFWRQVRLAGRTYDLPKWQIACAQYLLSMLDWTLSAAVLWVLVPDPTPAFAHVVVAFVVAQLVGAASHLPGGVGAFEAVMVAQQGPLVPIEGLLFALVAFRGIYYVAPCLAAIGILVADEGRVWWRRGGRPPGLAVGVVPRT